MAHTMQNGRAIITRWILNRQDDEDGLPERKATSLDRDARFLKIAVKLVPVMNQLTELRFIGYQTAPIE
jgi:hypothetical protein